MRRRGRPRHPDILTPREWEVLALLREGLSNPEISTRLGIGREAVKSHVSEILGKLGVSSRAEAAAWQPEQRPWWMSAAAPAMFVRRRLSFGWLSPALAGGVAVAVAAGAGILVWALLATGGDGRPSPSTDAAAATSTPDQAAIRELKEESGLTPGRLTRLGVVNVDPGLLAHDTHVFRAEDCTGWNADHSELEDQIRRVVSLPRAEAERRVAAGEIVHGPTLIALYLDRLIERIA